MAVDKDLSIIERVAYGGPGITVVISAVDFSILFVNQVFVQYFGAQYQKGSSFVALLDQYERDRFYKQLAIVCDGLIEQEFVVYNLKPEGKNAQPFFVYISILAGEGTSAFHLFLNPVRAKTYLPYSSSDTRDLFLQHFEAEACGTFEWIVDVDKVYWTSGVYRIYEVEPEIRDITFQFASRFVHPQDKERVSASVRLAIETGEMLHEEFRIITARNNVKWVNSLGLMVKDTNSTAVKFVGSLRDVTRQHAIHENLKAKMEELSRSNRELEDFAYAASHDLQEPLRKITTFSDRLGEKYRNVLMGEGEMYLKRMNASAENMRLLINGLLDFSRITQTQAPFAQVSLGLVIKQVLSDLELKIEETGTVVHFGVLPVVDAVATHMKQLFTNLITNAIKFHKPGLAPVISIATQAVTNEDVQFSGLPSGIAYHKIVVSDNGIGFEPQYTSRIFQVFQRLHGKSEYPGSGVGLAICKKILEHHKGVIYATSKKGEGATFTIIIPDRQICV